MYSFLDSILIACITVRQKKEHLNYDHDSLKANHSSSKNDNKKHLPHCEAFEQEQGSLSPSSHHGVPTRLQPASSSTSDISASASTILMATVSTRRSAGLRRNTATKASPKGTAICAATTTSRHKCRTEPAFLVRANSTRARSILLRTIAYCTGSTSNSPSSAAVPAKPSASDATAVHANRRAASVNDHSAYIRATAPTPAVSLRTGRETSCLPHLPTNRAPNDAILAYLAKSTAPSIRTARAATDDYRTTKQP